MNGLIAEEGWGGLIRACSVSWVQLIWEGTENGKHFRVASSGFSFGLQGFEK